MIGVYAHHQGSGHVQRALSVAAALDDEVTVLTSARIHADANPDPGRIRILPLPLDYDEAGTDAATGTDEATGPGPVAGDGPADPDPTAGGRLHWVPLRQAGLRQRMTMLAEWIGRDAPEVFWSDISVEVTLAARLTGTPVVTTVLPGRRDDAPHLLAHGVSSALVAGWPRAAGAPVPAGASRPLVPVGGVSRFAGRDPEPGARGHGRPRVLHLRGSGGGGHDVRWDAVRDQLDDVEWISLGGPGGRWVADPWDEIARADVVVSAAGQSSIADLAAADAHLVVVPEERPFDEQDATALTLANLGLAEVVGREDPVAHLVHAVRRTLERARSSPGAGSGLRRAWEVDGAAGRLARTLECVAAGREPGAEMLGAAAESATGGPR